MKTKTLQRPLQRFLLGLDPLSTLHMHDAVVTAPGIPYFLVSLPETVAPQRGTCAVVIFACAEHGGRDIAGTEGLKGGPADDSHGRTAKSTGSSQSLA